MYDSQFWYSPTHGVLLMDFYLDGKIYFEGAPDGFFDFNQESYDDFEARLLLFNYVLIDSLPIHIVATDTKEKIYVKRENT